MYADCRNIAISPITRQGRPAPVVGAKDCQQQFALYDCEMVATLLTILFSKSFSMTLAQTFQTHKICLNTTAARTGLLGVFLWQGIDTLRNPFLAIVIAKTKHQISHELSHSRYGALFGTSKHSAELLQLVIIHKGPSTEGMSSVVGCRWETRGSLPLQSWGSV